MGVNYNIAGGMQARGKQTSEETNSLNRNFKEGANHQTIMSNGTDKAAALNPSPYLAQFVRSNYKRTGGPSLNDSLDKLKNEFMVGYNEVMQESDAAYRLDTLTQKKAAASGARHTSAGPLAQMLYGASQAANAGAQHSPSLELQLVKEENETLKKVIEQMKLDMQTIVEKVKSTFNEQNADR